MLIFVAQWGNKNSNVELLFLLSWDILNILIGWKFIKHTLRSVDDVTEGITQESPMGGS